jgi:Recombinase/Recombinase zinc beta ribbon domain
MLLRVSTEEQEKKYGFPSQERSIREKLIEPLGLRLDTEKHIIKDTYTGSVRDGVPIRSIALILNEKGLKGPMGGEWLSSTLSDMLRNRTYIGEYHHFKQRNERVPGKRVPRRTPRPLKEQLIITVPALIDQGLFERVQRRLKDNQQFSRRNNQHPEDTLLQGGFAKCGYCHGTMAVNRKLYHWKDGQTVRWQVRYRCRNASVLLTRCQAHCSIDARELDEAAWEYLVDIIKRPNPREANQDSEKDCRVAA